MVDILTLSFRVTSHTATNWTDFEALYLKNQLLLRRSGSIDPALLYNILAVIIWT